jgi:hypothetical protein
MLCWVLPFKLRSRIHRSHHTNLTNHFSVPIFKPKAPFPPNAASKHREHICPPPPTINKPNSRSNPEAHPLSPTPHHLPPPLNTHSTDSSAGRGGGGGGSSSGSGWVWQAGVRGRIATRRACAALSEPGDRCPNRIPGVLERVRELVFESKSGW